MKSSSGDSFLNTGNVYYSKLILFLFPLQSQAFDSIEREAGVIGLILAIAVAAIWGVWRLDKASYEKKLKESRESFEKQIAEERKEVRDLLKESLSVMSVTKEKLSRSENIAESLQRVEIKMDAMYQRMQDLIK